MNYIVAFNTIRTIHFIRTEKSQTIFVTFYCLILLRSLESIKRVRLLQIQIIGQIKFLLFSIHNSRVNKIDRSPRSILYYFFLHIQLNERQRLNLKENRIKDREHENSKLNATEQSTRAYYWKQNESCRDLITWFNNSSSKQ